MKKIKPAPKARTFKTRVWMVSSEISPLAQTGGLGQVLRALPPALVRQGVSVRQFLPGYGCVEKKGFRLERKTWTVPLGTESAEVRFSSRLEKSGVETTLVLSDDLFGRSGIYGENGSDYKDNAKRFAFFCRTICEAMAQSTEPPDVVHCHDWPSALVPLFLRHQYSAPPTLLTLHNLAHQGVFPSKDLKWLSLGKELEKELFRPEGIEFWEKINFLKGGLLFADQLTTVSPSYAKEILTPEFGCGLDGVLRDRSKDLTGILNGADYDTWNPETDPHLPQRFGPKNLASGKRAAREVLRNALGLKPSSRPILGMVGRLAHQKGVDLLLDVAPTILELEMDLFVLGDGEPDLSEKLKMLKHRFSDRVGLVVGFDDRLAHLMFAGADFITLPSRFEPCGLAQLYALRYGTIPIAHKTGGLMDTVIDMDPNPKKGTGFVFDSMTPRAYATALRRALELQRFHPNAWASLRRRAMAQSFSWDDAAQRYVELYERLCKKR